jgi:hypothetical protein
MQPTQSASEIKTVEAKQLVQSPQIDEAIVFRGSDGSAPRVVGHHLWSNATRTQMVLYLAFENLSLVALNLSVHNPLWGQTPQVSSSSFLGIAAEAIETEQLRSSVLAAVFPNAAERKQAPRIDVAGLPILPAWSSQRRIPMRSAVLLQDQESVDAAQVAHEHALWSAPLQLFSSEQQQQQQQQYNTNQQPSAMEIKDEDKNSKSVSGQPLVTGWVDTRHNWMPRFSSRITPSDFKVSSKTTVEDPWRTGKKRNT